MINKCSVFWNWGQWSGFLVVLQVVLQIWYLSTGRSRKKHMVGNGHVRWRSPLGFINHSASIMSFGSTLISLGRTICKQPGSTATPLGRAVQQGLIIPDTSATPTSFLFCPGPVLWPRPTRKDFSWLIGIVLMPLFTEGKTRPTVNIQDKSVNIEAKGFIKSRGELSFFLRKSVKLRKLFVINNSTCSAPLG